MIIQGDALSVLRRMDSESVHMAVTSSPYYGLRSYGTDPQIWDGDPNCQHEWGEVHPPGYRKSDTNPGPLQHEGNKNRQNLKSDICIKCGAWKGELGQEATPEDFIHHLTTINHEVKRVLRSDGVYWVNIGDSYWGGKGQSGGGNPEEQEERYANGESINRAHHQVGGDRKTRPTDGKHPIIKPKDLIEIPSMLAASMRADGWYLRARIPWLKRNSLPSSVRDRPGSSIEYLFLFSKSQKYFYDYVATMQQSSESYNKDKRPRGVLRQCVNPTSKYPDEGQFKKHDHTGNPTYTGFNDRYEPNGLGLRYMRDSDFFFKTWQGLLHNEDGEPMALVVNPKGYKGAHFAAYPLNLCIPLILAGTSEKGVCPHCGAPWVRITKKGEFHNQSWGGEHIKGIKAVGGVGESSCLKTGGVCETITIDWKPSCSCENNIPIPATVLDPFSGSSATGVACKLYNRDYIGIELNPEYVKLGHKRIWEGK